MKKGKVILVLIHAIFSAHSHANCVTNELITWWLFHSSNWRVINILDSHDPTIGYYVIDNEYALTEHQTINLMRESSGTKWSVSEYYYLYGWNKTRYFADTYAVDCEFPTVGD